MAVDYVKTGQPAPLTPDLKPLKWPHFMEKVGKKQHQIYTSKKVLGQLYDQIERIDFVPAFNAPFDTRILQAYTLDENILRSASEIKEEYDAHMRRIMAQQEIKTEFEVWSTFVLQHSNTSNDFKYHEQIGEISMALKDQFRLICYERAGGKDYKHIGPFAAAMYEVTAREVTQAVEECHRVQMVGGQPRPLREMSSSNMPFMSFPWLFQDVLGKIAKSYTYEAVGKLSMRKEVGSKVAVQLDGIKAPQLKRGRIDPSRLDSDDYLKASKGTTHPRELLESLGKSNKSGECKGPAEAEYISSSSISVKSSSLSKDTSMERSSSVDNGLIDHSSSSSPELLARKSRDDYPSYARIPVESDSKSWTSLESQLHISGSPLYSGGRIEAADLAGKEHTTALNETLFERVDGDKKALSVELQNYTTPEGSNLRLLDDLMMGLSDRSDDKVGYSRDSDAESDEVVIPIDTRAGLLDQLAAIAGDSASHASGINASPFAIPGSVGPKLDRSESESVPVSLIPGAESRERD